MHDPNERLKYTRHIFFVLIASFALLNFGILAFVQMGILSLESKAQLLIGELLVIIPPLIYIVKQNLPVRETLRLNPIRPQLGVVSLFLVIPVFIISEELDRLVQFIITVPDDVVQMYEQLFTASSSGEWLYLILVVGLMAGFVEECIFRGLVQGILEKQLDITRAILVTAFLFAFMHANPFSIVQIVLLAVVLGVLAWRSHSILPGFIIHACYNSLAVIYKNAPELFSWISWRGHVNPVFIVIAFAMLISGFRYFYHLTERMPHR